jgi:muramoyltetrapeptide carboxypeptidase LdcA involved in peptidoglycan recycling
MPAEKGILPRALRKGDTIAFVSPSARLNHIMPLAINRSKAHLESLGYKVKVIFNNGQTSNFREATLQRCEEIHSAFRDPEVKAIICTIGGAHANELVPHLDYDLVRANPKIFCGYSDTAVLHHAIFKETRLQTFYGPAAISELADYPKPIQFVTDNLLYVLSGSGGKALGPVPRSSECAWELPAFFEDPNSLEIRSLIPSPPWTWIRPGKATGRIFGGTMNCLNRLKGTPYWPDYRGRVLLLESAFGKKFSDPIPQDDIRGWLADLVLSGVFQQISGLVLGRFSKYDEAMRKEVTQIVLDQLQDTSFPILANVDIGHVSPILTIPLNALVRLDSDQDELSILEPAVLDE